MAWRKSGVQIPSGPLNERLVGALPDCDGVAALLEHVGQLPTLLVAFVQPRCERPHVEIALVHVGVVMSLSHALPPSSSVAIPSRTLSVWRGRIVTPDRLGPLVPLRG